jgi:hypothetical protein
MKVYILDYPLYGYLQNNTIFGHVGFFWNPLDIFNRIIYHYLISKISKRIFIKINLWAQESQLECFWGEYSQCDSNKIGTSSTFLFFMCILLKIPNYGNFFFNILKPQYWENFFYKQAITYVIRIFRKKLCCKSLCKIYFKKLSCSIRSKLRFNFVNLILHQNLH